MKLIFLLLLILLSIPNFHTYSQKRSESRGNVISGSIIDQKTLTPIEFATIMIHNSSDDKQLTGVVSDASGSFRIENLPSISVYIKVSYIGFELLQTKNYNLTGEAKIELGKIYLKSKDIGMKDVVVKSERVPISYQIDKKVINVSENITTLSGTAVDVLENVPSVTVDIDGNVSLRGSGNFTVLIDGRPTILDANTALQQIPASSIENIEIITNPSAKYDPEGTSGIINLILQKNKNTGFSGIAGINAGLKDKYGTDILTDYKTNFAQYTFGINYNKRNMTSSEIGRNWTNNNGTYSYYNSDGNSLRKNDQLGLRGGVTLDFGEDKILTFGGRYNKREGNEGSVLQYYEWTSLATEKIFYNSINNGTREGGEYQLNASYNYPFNKNGHELSIELDFEKEDGNDVTTNNLFNNAQLIDGKKTSESGPGNEFTSKIDYQLPLGEDSKFEAGYQGELQLSNEVTELENYNPISNVFEKNPLFVNDIKYYTNQLALYSIYADKLNELGFKLGLRSEYTGREVKIKARNQNYSLDQWDFFPTAHFSYNFGSGNQVMTSYTRRINRPHGWEFEPFLTWIDAYNVRIGNPSILPEYIDSYELGFQKVIGNSLFSVDSYYRLTKNKIDRIRSYYSENVTLQTPQNIGKDYALGAELFINFDPVERWNVNLMGNLYDYKIKGQLNSTNFDRSSFNWNVRFNNTVKFSQETMIQINLMYNSPTVSSQGSREGYLSTNLAVKQTLLHKSLTATLQIRDLFSAASNKAVNESFDFYSYRYSQRESPVVMLNLRFNFNNFQERERDNSNGEDFNNGE